MDVVAITRFLALGIWLGFELWEELAFEDLGLDPARLVVENLHVVVEVDRVRGWVGVLLGFEVGYVLDALLGFTF